MGPVWHTAGVQEVSVAFRARMKIKAVATLCPEVTSVVPGAGPYCSFCPKSKAGTHTLTAGKPLQDQEEALEGPMPLTYAVHSAHARGPPVAARPRAELGAQDGRPGH